MKKVKIKYRKEYIEFAYNGKVFFDGDIIEILNHPELPTGSRHFLSILISINVKEWSISMPYDGWSKAYDDSKKCIVNSTYLVEGSFKEVFLESHHFILHRRNFGNWLKYFFFKIFGIYII